MFCFCLQRSLIKLRSFEVDGCRSLRTSPEDSPQTLDSKEPKGPDEEKETLALCHTAPTEENGASELLALNTSPQSSWNPSLTTTHTQTTSGVLISNPQNPVHSPQRTSSGVTCEGGQDDRGGGALLQLLTGGGSPLPSPRCCSHSQRFNSDPDIAPSPPCSQPFILSRTLSEGTDDARPLSVSFLSRHIQTLKRRVRRFEDHFEQEMNYKPSHNDKYSNPEMVTVMNELAKARKQLKELRLRQSVFESKEQDGLDNSDTCRYSGSQQGAAEHKPSLEETVECLFRRVREKRRELGLPDNMKEMTQAQMVLEKITLQKCLLYFESLHGRPGTKQERILVKPLYDRYHMIKRLLCASPTITTIEEDDSDEDSAVDERPAAPPSTATWPLATEEDSDRDSDHAFISPLDEVKAVRQRPALTTANLHEASRSQLLECLRETRAEKKTRRKVLREFEDEFYRQTGRTCQKEDRAPMKDEYHDYKQVKAKLRLLEVLLSKQEDTKNI
ncbi:protein FAM13C isoform X2 [Thalassophryne amazonica]|uniref:protein FAM13C isoform X2 n=1 Tax=Thalassophryne amazonica TaxID=390379 RepID=UPI001471E1A3|nr:protein FAM13C isoform X2 [Thalassophryne amazonica]